MEISVVNKSTVPKLEGWTKILQNYIQYMPNGDKAIMINIARNENWKGIESAWRKIAIRNKKIPHIKTSKHQLGITIYLYWK